MGAQPARNSARLFAPAALAVFAIFFFVVVLSSGSDDKKDNGGAATSDARGSKPSAKSQPRKPTASTYTVKLGDNLPAISRKTGLSVQKIQELNPALDPYGLQSGQKIKLREGGAGRGDCGRRSPPRRPRSRRRARPCRARRSTGRPRPSSSTPATAR